MKKQTLIVLSLLVGFVCFPQQIKLKGQASIHNSKYDKGKIEYVKDVFVTAPFTKSSSTDKEGKFVLEFVGITPGTSIKLKAEKANLEIVNENELQQVVISRKQPLRIFLTDKGQLAEAQTEFYNISKKALFAEKNSMIERLRGDQKTSKAAISDLKKKFGQEISDRFEAEQLLNAKIEAQEKNLPQFALNLASQNLDFASNLFIEAYEHFKKGNIEKAIETLDSEKLEVNLTQAKNNITAGKEMENIAKETQEKGYLGAEQTINSYNLKAESYALKFNYKNAIQEYERIISFYLDPKLEYGEGELSQWYRKASTNYFFDGKYAKALDYQLKEIEILEKLHGPDDFLLVEPYANIATVYREFGNYNVALDYQKRVISIVEKNTDAKNPIFGGPYYAIAGTYSFMGRGEEAIANYEKALTLFLKNPNQDVYGLAVTYSNMAVHFGERGDYQKALEYTKKGIQTVEGHLEPEHPIMISLLAGLGSCHSSLGEYEKALGYELRCIALLEKIYDKEHPSLVSVYGNIGSTYSMKGDYEKALEYQSKVLEIRKRILPLKHPDLVLSYNNLANTYYAMKDYKNALQLCEDALVIAEEIYTRDHYALFNLYDSLTYIYSRLENYEQTLFYRKKMVATQERTLDRNSLDLANGYLDLAYAFADVDDYRSAQDYGNKAIRIFKTQLPADHPTVLSLISTLDSLEKIIENEKD